MCAGGRVAVGHAWQGVCMAGGMHGRGCVWQGVMHGKGECITRGYAWQGHA